MARAVVVDAGFAIQWVLPEPHSPETRALLGDWRAGNVDRLVHDLFDFEVSNGFYRQCPAAEGRDWLARNLAGLLSMVTLTPPTPRLLDRAAEIAELLGEPASYDAQYADLAEAEGRELWTADERFWWQAQTAFPWVRWIGEQAAAASR